MIKLCFIFMILFSVNANAQTMNAEQLKLSENQNQKLMELKDNMKAEIQPILEEVQDSRKRIFEIEKKYFEEFWKMLSEEQKQEFLKVNKK